MLTANSQDTIVEGGSALVFCATKNYCERFCYELSQHNLVLEEIKEASNNDRTEEGESGSTAQTDLRAELAAEMGRISLQVCDFMRWIVSLLVSSY